MNSIKVAGLVLVSQLMAMQQAFAGTTLNGGSFVIPEIDGAGAIISIGLVIGLVALVREKFFHK